MSGAGDPEGAGGRPVGSDAECAAAANGATGTGARRVEVEEPAIEEKAAKFAGLMAANLGPREGCCLPRFIAENEKDYIRLRNGILVKWYSDPCNFLSFEKASEGVEQKEVKLTRAIFDFLSNYGYINSGVLPDHPGFNGTGPKNPHKSKIIVIGAGMSGITAARQLKSFGHEVTVIEGRNRLGGRVNTDLKRFESPVDLGASIITGLTGNPLGVVTKQIETKVHNIGSKCPLFRPDGKELPTEEDALRYSQFNQMDVGANGQIAEDLKRRNPKALNKMNLLSAMRRIQREEFSDIEESGKQIINWHIANLEYGCGTNLRNLSLAHWNQDDPYGFEGCHLFLKEGYSTVVEKLAEGLDVRLGHRVERVTLSTGKGVSVRTFRREGEETEEFPEIFEADIVLVTVSLGVLKSGMIKFTPSLPMWKLKAINGLGFGLINKLVLEWKEEDVFWCEEDMFGHVKENEDERGNNYMFWNLKNVTGKPILVSIFCGDAAIKLEDTPIEKLVEEAMLYLRRIFGQNISDPIRTHKTSWKKDPFARGTYSFVKVGASGRDYDALARPVDGKLFFAGEATCRLYPATVPGAHASGLFAAGQIADACNPVKHELFMESADSIMKRLKLKSINNSRNRFRRGIRPTQRAQGRYNKLRIGDRSTLSPKMELESTYNDLMDGKWDLDASGETETKVVNDLTQITEPGSMESPISVDDNSVVDLVVEERGKKSKLPRIRPFEHKRRGLEDDSGIVDMTDAIRKSNAKKRKRDESWRKEFRKKLKTKVKQKELAKKQTKSSRGGNETMKSDFVKYIKKFIQRYVSKCAERYALSESVQRKILSKSSDRVIAEWSSKEREVSIKDWMHNEKRKKNMKDFVSKYAKGYAKRGSRKKDIAL